MGGCRGFHSAAEEPQQLAEFQRDEEEEGASFNSYYIFGCDAVVLALADELSSDHHLSDHHPHST